MIDLRHAIPTDLLRSPRVIASAVAVTVLAIVGVTAMTELGGSLLAPGVDPERADRVSPEFTRHEQMALIHRKRFEGRGLFTTPLKPPSPWLPVTRWQGMTMAIVEARSSRTK